MTNYLKMPCSQPILLEPMAQQPRLLGMKDDWTGITSSSERRRLQNRLNQRASRKRKQNENRACSTISKLLPPCALQYRDSGSWMQDVAGSESPGIEEIERVLPLSDLWSLFDSAARNLDCQTLSRVAKLCKLTAFEQKRAILEFEKWMEQYQGVGSIRADQLLVLVKFNVFRAMINNANDLGLPDGQGMEDDDALSPLSDPSNWASVLRVPAALEPTKFQRRIPHHPWIDTIPFPGMRDNLLKAGDTYDDGELCADLVGFCNPPSGRTGMIIWGEPWDPNGWEMTEDFIKHWGWTVKGCKQLFQATNYWREQRGEEPLKFDRILYDYGSD